MTEELRDEIIKLATQGGTVPIPSEEHLQIVSFLGAIIKAIIFLLLTENVNN